MEVDFWPITLTLTEGPMMSIFLIWVHHWTREPISLNHRPWYVCTDSRNASRKSRVFGCKGERKEPLGGMQVTEGQQDKPFTKLYSLMGLRPVTLEQSVLLGAHKKKSLPSDFSVCVLCCTTSSTHPGQIHRLRLVRKWLEFKVAWQVSRRLWPLRCRRSTQGSMHRRRPTSPCIGVSFRCWVIPGLLV